MNFAKLYCVLFLSVACLLGGCAELDRQMKISMYGSVEEGDRVEAKYEAQRQKKFEENAKELEEDLYRRITDERRKVGAFVRTMDRGMLELARARVQEVAEKYSEIRPNGRHNSTLYREMSAQVPSAMPRKEARAKSVNRPKDVLKFWLSQKESREAILNKSVSRYAVSVCLRDGVYYWVFVGCQ